VLFFSSFSFFYAFFSSLFNDDPQEFIRKVHNPISDWLSPMLAATTLLQTLARYRQKDVMPLFLPFLQSKAFVRLSRLCFLKLFPRL
jgi:hypothetical protein